MQRHKVHLGDNLSCRLILVLAILLIAFGLRTWNLNSESIWHDEGWSIRAIRGPFTTPDDNTPFLYYFTGHLMWKLGAGDSPLALRYLSVLIGLLTTTAALRLGQRWYGTMAGLAAGLMVAASPLLWEYSQEVRAYVAVPLIALAMLAAAGAILRHRPGDTLSRRLWLFVFVVELAGLYTHNLSVPLVVWLNVALGAVWLLRRDWTHMRTWAGLQIGLIVGYIPWLLTQSPSGTPLNTPPEPGLNLAKDVWASYFLPVMTQLLDAKAKTTAGADLLTPLTLFVALGIGLVCWATVALLRTSGGTSDRTSTDPIHDHATQRITLWLLLSHAILVPIFSTALMLAANIDFHPRYYIAAVPGTLLLLAGAMAFILENPLRRVRQPKHVAGGYAIVLTPVLLFSALSIHQINATRAYQHDDFAGLAHYYATLPDDAVILIPFDVERALQDYYVDVLDIQAQIVNVPLHSDEQTALEVINNLLEDQARQVEFLTWFQLPADVRGMYPCLLTGFSEHIREPKTFYGLMTQNYLLRQGAAVTPISAAPRYQDMTLQDLAYLPSANGVCLRSSWTLEHPVEDNTGMAAAVLNPFGQEIARADAEITRPDNTGTAHWDTNTVGAAYHLLRLPAGAPLSAYDLTLSLYDDAQISGLDLLDSAGNPAGRSYHLETVIQAKGPPASFAEPALLSDNSGQDSTVETGRPLDVTLALRTDSSGIITLAGDGWALEQSAPQSTGNRISWHRFIIAPGNSGPAALSIDDVVVAQYTVIDPPRTFTLPEFDTAVDAVFPGVGTLVGVTIGENTLSPDRTPEVTLIWQADGQISNPAYTVFVQLLAEDGRLLAQSDRQPADGTRPTTGWIAGEYIIDHHALAFSVTDYSGAAYLIAGFYDAAVDFRRVSTAEGMDHTRIPVEISANP